MKRLHKLLVVLLSLSVLFGAIAITAMAADDTVAQIGNDKYTSLAAAFDAANKQTVEEGAEPEPIVIELKKDAALSAGENLTLSLDKLNLTIDLGGHTLDVSSVGAPEEKNVKSAVYLRGAESALTVKNGVIINSGESNGVFAIENGIVANLFLEDLQINAKGGAAMAIAYVRSGKTEIKNCELVSYGVNAYVIRQTGDAEVIIQGSQLFNIDGEGENSAVIKTDATSNGRLYTEREITENGEPTFERIERPHIYAKDSELFAAANVLVAYLAGESRPSSARYSEPWIVLEDCNIEQCNKNEYNEDGKLLTASHNYVYKGNYCYVDFIGCNVEYARVALKTEESTFITVKDSVFNMTHLGQTHYSESADAPKMECDSYFVMGNGDVFVSGTVIFLQKTKDNKYVPIADSVALEYAKNLDALSEKGFKLGEGCVTNTTESLSSIEILAFACKTRELSGDGAYIYSYVNPPEKFKDEWSSNWYVKGQYRAKLVHFDAESGKLVTKKYKTFEEAYNAAQTGDRIDILYDISGIKTVEKQISVTNFVGYEFKHTSSTYKSVSGRGYTEFSAARRNEITKVTLVTNDGTEKMEIAAGNYVVYDKTIKEGWHFDDYKYVNFLGWGTSADVANLGGQLPYIDGTSASIKIYAVYESQYNLNSDYAITDLEGKLVKFGGKYDELTVENKILDYKDQVIVILKDINADKPIRVTAAGNIYIDLNGHTIVTNGNYFYESIRDAYVSQYDSEGNEVRRYYNGKSVAKVDEATGEWVKLGAGSAECKAHFSAASNSTSEDPILTASAMALGDTFKVNEGNNTTPTALYLFSSAPGAFIDTGDGTAFYIYSAMRNQMKDPSGVSIVTAQALTTYNILSIGNSAFPVATSEKLSRIDDNQITIECRSLTYFSYMFTHQAYIDDVYVIAESEEEAAVALNGIVCLHNSVFVNKSAGAGIVSFSMLRYVDINNCTFVATPGASEHASAFTNIELSGKFKDPRHHCKNENILHIDDTYMYPKREITDCNFIDCYISAKSGATERDGVKIAVKNAAYNLPNAATKGTVKFTEIEASNEQAIWNKTVVVGGDVHYLPYKLIKGEAPEIVTVTWVDSEGKVIATEKYFRGAKAVCPEINSADRCLYSATPVVFEDGEDGKDGKYVPVTDVDLDNLQNNITVMVKAEDFEIKYNVNISDELTISIYIPVLQSGAVITGVTLFDPEMYPDAENIMENTVIKDGVEYYKVSSKAVSPNRIDSDVEYYITITKTESDGTVHTAIKKISVSILDYAKQLLEDEESSEKAKALVTAMLVYANEAYKYFDGAENAEVAQLIASAEITAPTAESEKNVADISEHITSVSLQLKSRVAFIFEVKEGIDTITLNGNEYAVEDGTVVYSCNVAEMNDLISIEIDGAEGAYDLLAYIASASTARDVAIALYCFAGASDAYAAE